MATTDDGSVGLSQNADPAILQYQNRPERMPQFMGTAVGPAATAEPATPAAPAATNNDGGPINPGAAARQAARRAARQARMGTPTTRLGSMTAERDDGPRADSRSMAPVPGPNTMGLAPQAASGFAAPSGTLGTGSFGQPMAGQTQGYPVQPTSNGFSTPRAGQTQGYPVDWK